MSPLRARNPAEKAEKKANSKKIILPGEEPKKKRKKRTKRPPASARNPLGLLKKEYREKAHERWAKIVKGMAGNRCVLCGSDYNLNAHHMIHNTRSGFLRYDLKNGLSLCFAHHHEFHFSDSQNAWEYMQKYRPDDYAYILANKRNPPPKLTIGYYASLIDQFDTIIAREGF